MKTPELSPYELAFQAESGDPGAQFRLGMLFLLGEKVEQDLPAAYRWISRAAEAQHPGAQQLANKLGGVEGICPSLPESSLDKRRRRRLSRAIRSLFGLAGRMRGLRPPLDRLHRERGVRPAGTAQKSSSLVDAA